MSTQYSDRIVEYANKYGIDLDQNFSLCNSIFYPRYQGEIPLLIGNDSIDGMRTFCCIHKISYKSSMSAGELKTAINHAQFRSNPISYFRQEYDRLWAYQSPSAVEPLNPEWGKEELIKRIEACWN